MKEKKTIYRGIERRKFARLDFITPLAYKICKKRTISKILKGYTKDISQAGALCSMKEKVKKGDLLWLSFERGVLNICAELDNRTFIYQNGIVGKVVWVKRKPDNTYSVGIQFITREEKNLSHIYPQIHFLKDKFKLEEPQEAATEEETEPEESSQEEQSSGEDYSGGIE